MLTFILISEHLWSTRPSYLPNIYAHKGQGSFLLEQSQDLSCTNSPRTTISGDVCGDSTDQRAKGIEYACERKGQDATKITSAFADSCIQFLWSVMPIPMTTLTWMRKNTPNRNTIEDFTAEIDEAGLLDFPADKNVEPLFGSHEPSCSVLRSLLPAL